MEQIRLIEKLGLGGNGDDYKSSLKGESTACYELNAYAKRVNGHSGMESFCGDPTT